MKRFVNLAVLALASVQGFAEDYSIQRVYSKHKLERPVAAEVVEAYPNKLFVAEQRGRLNVLDRDESKAPQVFFDITHLELEQDRGKFEEGLVGFAFHPEHKTNQLFYVAYTLQHPKRLRISEFKGSYHNSSKDNLKTERVLLEIRQPFWNHNSGNLVFGPEGYLYIGVGDGGYKDDLRRLAQNLFVLNGKILRIDVNRKDKGLEYAIPKSNPFVQIEIGPSHLGNGIRHEIYAYGIRNPWGTFYDKQEDLFWFADVGQNKFEEINLLEAGANYGWSYREGFEKFERRDDQPLPSAKFVEPIQVYPREDGVSVTGGFVYRGKNLKEIQGDYLYGDWSSGSLFALDYDKATKKVTENRMIFKREVQAGQKPLQPTAIVEGLDGEALLLSWHGELYHLVE